MNMNPGNGRGEFSIDWVKSRLKALSAVEPSQSLKDGLVAGIPAVAGGEPITRGVWPWLSKGRWIGAAAAAVIVAASTIAWLGMPWGRPMRSGIEVNAGPSRVYATDHNSLRPSDTNVCDINSLR